MAGRRRTAIGTFGTIHFEKLPGGQVRARTRYRDDDGQLRRVSAVGRTQKAAERSLKEAIAARASRTTYTEVTPDSSFTRLVELWLDDLDLEGKVAESTRALYERNMRQLVMPAFENYTLREITTGRVDRFLKTLAKSKSYSTAKQAKTVLNLALGLAVRYDALRENPVRETARLNKPPSQAKALTVEQIEVIRTAAHQWRREPGLCGPPPDGQLEQIIDVMLGTSARIGEVLAIRKCDVDVTSSPATVRICGTIVSPAGKPTHRQAHPKTASSTRTVSVPSWTAAVLRERLVKVSSEEAEHLIFFTRNKTPLTTNNVRRRLRAVLEGTGVEGVTPHSFRRTVATFLDRAGGADLAAEMLGHSSSEITKQHYIEPDEAVNPVTAEILEVLAPRRLEGDLRDRLIAARDLLTEAGSCFVQIGDENVHLVRSLLDEVFGAENFVSQIVFATTSGFTQAVGLGRSGDLILWYAKDIEQAKMRPLLRESRVETGYNWVMLPDGTRRTATRDERADVSLLPKGARLYRNDNLRSQGASSKDQNYEYAGKTWHPGARLHWKTSCPEGMDRLAWAGRIHAEGSNLEYVRYLEDSGWATFTNVWNDTVIGGFTDEKMYVVQTTTKVVGRCMLLCTDPGDLVLDPTCGSGTTAAVAEHWGRRWITVDTSRVAIALARQRIMGARFPWFLLSDSPEGAKKELELSAGSTTRAVFNRDIREGFVYERARRITLGSIANNPDIQPGMSPAAVETAINRHAEFRLLFDRPYEDPVRLRVAGPFTVESLSPHRALSFGDAPESLAETDAAKDSDGPNFEQSILENLAKAGIQNGKRAEKLKFEAFETYAGQYIQAIGQQIPNGEHASPSRIGIAIGPQYGTVSAKYVKDAAREAIRAEDIDLLCVLGFAFDPQATNVTEEDGFTIEASDEGFAQIEGARNVGRLPVLMVRMNADLLMGEELKKTGSGNLFTVFGEPDIDLRSTDEGYIVDLKGVDIYDPTTGEVRSSDTGQIALWMIDTDYNEESFFVRHCYFTGGNDPYKRLKTALKADIDADAWESLYQTVSRPFPKPSTGKIAVKVINDYGDEVMKVFEVSD